MTRYREEQATTCTNVYAGEVFVAQVFEFGRNTRWYFELKQRPLEVSRDANKRHGFRTKREAIDAAIAAHENSIGENP